MALVKSDDAGNTEVLQPIFYLLYLALTNNSELKPLSFVGSEFFFSTTYFSFETLTETKPMTYSV